MRLDVVAAFGRLNGAWIKSAPSAFSTFPRKRGKEAIQPQRHPCCFPRLRGKLPGGLMGTLFVRLKMKRQSAGCAGWRRVCRTLGMALARAASSWAMST